MIVDYDFIVLGSGPSGAMAAQTLVDAGKQVAMVDVGVLNDKSTSILLNGDFEYLRRTDSAQNRYFLGDAFEAVNWQRIKAGAQLTPARMHLMRDVEKLIPMASDTFFPMESLAYGGLGSGWGLGTYVYSDKELESAGLNAYAMKAGYQTVCNRIGISAGKDDITQYVLGDLKNTLPPLELDNSSEKLLSIYQKKKKHLNRKGVYLGRSSLALLSQPFEGRRATQYKDMDFYTDWGESAYRPWITVNTLKQKENFAYLGNRLAIRFKETEEGVSLDVFNLHTQERTALRCRRLILAAGALGTARIALRSFSEKIERLPILCNPYTYVPCINIQMLGRPLSNAKTSMAQLFMIYDEGHTGKDLVSVAFYTYRSLLLYRIIKEVPLGFSDGLGIMRSLQSALVIAGVHHSDTFSNYKYLKLIKSKDSVTGDMLFAHYELEKEDIKKIKRREAVVLSSTRFLGCYPIMSINPGFGASIHYAGTMPFNNSERLGTLRPNGQVNGMKNVFVADSSGYTYLPAKGITLTIMANAHLVALEALKS